MATLRETFSDIASAIRAKGVSGTMKPIEMASKIGEIKTGGWLPPPEIPDDVTGIDLTLYSCEDNNTYQFRSYNPNYSTTKPTVPASWDGGSALTNTRILNAGEQIKIVRSNNNTTCRFGAGDNNTVILTPTGKTYVYGDFSKQHIALNPPEYCYARYFYGNSHIDIPKRGGLICKAMSAYCYYNMFFGCTSLTQAPELPATTLADSCYYSMFVGCSSLTQAPVLPATNLAQSCYRNMFYYCKSLTQAPELPATNLADSCYNYMFSNCKSLTQAHVLPATTLAYSCYRNMFSGCTSLTQAPELPATTLADNCYDSMFNGCISLTQAPELPATTLAYQCYYQMFRDCTSLTTAPALPATTLATNCYTVMFKGCTSLISAPELPATTLADRCYSNMFSNCTSLTQAPELPATTLADNCYSNMFNGCKSLKRIKMNASSGSWGSGMFNGCTSLELVDMTGSTGVPTLSNVNNFDNTNNTYKIVVPDSLYDTWIAETNWASIASHIMKKSDWNTEHPDDILG